jgi:thiol-disulfide isomerase/thioredoxin
MIQFNQEKLDQDLASGKRLYIYYYLPGCGPCKNLTPKVEDFASGRDNVYFITAKDQAVLPEELHPPSYPSILLVENNFLLAKEIGQSGVLKLLKNG